MHRRHPLCVLARWVWVLTVVLTLAGCSSRADFGVHDVLDAQSLLDPPVPVYTLEREAASVACAEDLRAQDQGLRSWRELAPALERSRNYVAAREQDAIAVAHGEVTLLWSEVLHTLDMLHELLPRLDAEPELLGRHFRWLRLTQGADFSGYFEPVVRASRTRSGEFVYPLYRIPPDLQTLDLGAFAPSYIGQRVQYRTRRGQAVPYYTRHDIDGRGVLRRQGLELAYVADPLDAFFLQVQGSGRLVFQDGQEQPVLFAATNGHPYVGIGRVLRDRGLLHEAVSMDTVRSWLTAHPERQREILDLNERYVFFRFAAEGPSGGMGALLTPWVSLAVDRNLLPLGVPVAYAVHAPFADGSVREVRGLGLAQDTGSAMRGRRIDIFCGTGAQAAYTAGRLNTPGVAWLLVARATSL